MIDLAQRSGPYEISLPYGLAVTMKPPTAAGVAAAQSGGPGARLRRSSDRSGSHGSRIGSGRASRPLGGGRAGWLHQPQLIRELAIRHIKGWTGVNTDWRKPCGDRAGVAVVAAIANGSPDIRVYGSFVQEDEVMAEVRETEEVRQWRAKVTTFNFDVDCVGGTMTGLLRRATELEQERVALGLDDMAVVDPASAQKLIDRATALRGLASRDPL
jgi:hypothetical protein